MNPAPISKRHRRLANAAGRVPAGYRAVAGRVEKKSFALIFMYALWAIVVFDLHRYLGHVGPAVLQRGLAIMFYGLIALMAINSPTFLSNLKSEKLAPPMLCYVAVAVVTVPFAVSTLAARNVTQMLLLYYLLLIATINFVRTPRQTIPILLMFPIQYAWWAFHAKASGQVKWHSIYANFDGFGPLAVMGMGVCFYFALSAKSKLFTWLNLALAGYCVLGVVASFARGAVLSAGLVAFIIWYRSPRKVVTASALALGMVVLLISTKVLFPGEFWPEIASAFSEGTQEGTGRDRWELWNAAFRVFLTQPLTGVGPGQFGPAAASLFGAGEIYGYENPAHLYDRNLHSVFVQIFTEFGILGTSAFIWILVDFFKRNRALQNSEASLAWALATGGRFELRYILIALEMAMVGYLSTGFFYAQLYNHWMYTLIAANLMLCLAVQPEYERLRMRARAGPVRGTARRLSRRPSGGRARSRAAPLDSRRASGRYPPRKW